jgi:thiol-disulfide isomerase/thioredoxin
MRCRVAAAMSRFVLSRSVLSLAVFFLGACRPVASRSADEDPAPQVARATPTPHLRFVPAGEGDVVPLVRAFVTEARAEGRLPLVYVGASWCEPCRYFHAAAERGELDAVLPPLALLELDRDRDGARLDAAGYASRMIPLFVVPDADGRPTDRRIEGSIHGADSPSEITPRLRAILEGS